MLLAVGNTVLVGRDCLLLYVKISFDFVCLCFANIIIIAFMSPKVVLNPPWRGVLKASTFSSRLAIIPEWLVCTWLGTESRALV